MAVTDPTVDPDAAVQGVPTVPVNTDGVPMDTSTTDPAGVGGSLLQMTLSYHEAASTGTAANGPVRLHSPWLRLMPTTGFSDDGEQVVPRRGDTRGGAESGDGAGREYRRVVGRPRRGRGDSGFLEPDRDQGWASNRSAWRSCVHGQNGDLDLTLTPGTGGPAVTAVAVDGATGTVRLASGDLEAQGAGSRRPHLRPPVRCRSGSWRLVDATASADRLAVDAAGRVTIGTGAGERILHVEGSEVHSGGWQGGFSFADRRVHRVSWMPRQQVSGGSGTPTAGQLDSGRGRTA